jgi:hypothetical protein
MKSVLVEQERVVGSGYGAKSDAGWQIKWRSIRGVPDAITGRVHAHSTSSLGLRNGNPVISA